jgi:hypothetical protein
VPPEYWQYRLRVARAMGLNTVCAYLDWHIHGVIDLGREETVTGVRFLPGQDSPNRRNKDYLVKLFRFCPVENLERL